VGRRPRGATRAAVKQMGLLKPMEKWLIKRIEKPRYQHIFLGNVNRRARKGTGFHHRYQGKNPPTARVRRHPTTGNELRDPPNSHGAYKAKVDVRDEDGQWYEKRGKSSFFPDHWTPKQVDEAINSAFKNARPDPTNPNKWVGTHNGMQIEGFYQGNLRKGWYSAWPVV
jgi:hypothetical protein